MLDNTISDSQIGIRPPQNDGTVLAQGRDVLRRPDWNPNIWGNIFDHLKEITSEWITVDEGKPTTKIQFRMEDGRKLIQKFNHDHTMSDIFLFVGAQDNFDVPFIVSSNNL